MAEGIRLGKYVLLERVAVGGMAEVFRAAAYGAQGFAKELIIKRILPDIAEDATFVQMFVDEARLASMLEHPNIVQVFDFESAEGTYFIAMEYVRGRDLAHVLKQARDRKIKLPEPTAMYIFAQLLEALRYAHEKNVIHRDVSPQNILLSFEGEVKLADFGIAKAAGTSRTATGSLKGKYRYMAPEYVKKQSVDHKSDIYAAGAVLYELLTNERPFREGNDMGLLNDIAEGNYRRPREVDPNIPPAMAALIETAMALDPAKRFPSARAFLDAVKETCRAREIELSSESVRRHLATHASREIEAARTEIPTTADRPTSAEPATKLLAPAPPSIRTIWLPVMMVLCGLLAAVIAYQVAKPPKQLRVLMRMMTVQEDWIKKEAFAPFAAEESFEIPISRYRSVQDVEDELRADPSISLVKVNHAMLRPLVEADLLLPLDTFLKDRGRGAELDQLRAAFDPQAVDMATVADHVALRWYGIPRKVENSVLVYRRSRVLEAAARWGEYREDLEGRLMALLGHGLPHGYVLEPDPAEWDRWDVFVAAYFWARADGEGRTMNRSYDYIGTYNHLYDELSSLSSESVPALAVTKPMIDLFEWESLSRELGLYREQMFAKEEVVTGRVLEDAMAAGDIYLTKMHSLGIKLIWDAAAESVKNDLRFAILPIGVSAQLDGEGRPARTGSRRATVGGWFWAIPKRAPLPEEGYRLALHLTGRGVAEREVAAFLIQSGRIDVRAPDGPLAAMALPVLAAQMELDAGHRLPIPPTRKQLDANIGGLVGAWKKIVVERNYLEEQRIDRKKLARELKSALSQSE
jgi:tRNA A-37 threonylcarbamoyl transferase component Bud32